jgi:hypothetical protein
MLKKHLQRIILILIALLGLKTGIESLLSSTNERSNGTAVVSNWDARLSQLTKQIPFKRGLVGYVSNEDILGSTFSSSDTAGEYVLTQFSVAPLILVRGADQEWDILNLSDNAYEKWHQAHSKDFEVVISTGGMYLVHRVNK